MGVGPSGQECLPDAVEDHVPGKPNEISRGDVVFLFNDMVDCSLWSHSGGQIGLNEAGTRRDHKSQIRYH